MSSQGVVPKQQAQPPQTKLSTQLTSQAISPQAELVGYHGREALSRPYQFEIGLSVPNDVEVDMHGALGHRSLLEVDRGIGTAPFVINGVLAAMELVARYQDRTLYIATLVPQLWQLSLSHHSRIFTDGTIVEIIEAVLKDSGLTSYAFQLSENYRKWEHVCQYRESNLAFISRLMEREGMYYFFEQGASEEKLIITDSKLFHQELGSGIVQFGVWSQQQSQDLEMLEAFRCRASALPSKVTLNDYDYMNPSLDLHCSQPVATSSPGQIVLYGENYQTPAVGQQYAKIRAEEYLARQTVFDGTGWAYDVRPGYLFKLEQHPQPDFNARYLTTEMEHWGRRLSGVTDLDELLDLHTDDVHRVSLKAIADQVQFRPRRTTIWPRVDGVVDGTVDGSVTSPYAQIDDQGRYKVKVFFDESDLLDGSASTWIRMLQPHGGGTEGIHFPLRKGTEVHILFLGGDPDRPVITGVAPNTQKPSKVTSGNNTHNVIMTGGSNRVEMEDAEGGQYIDISCPVMDSFIHLGSASAGRHAGGFNFVSSTEGRWKQYSMADRYWQVDSFSVENVKGAVTQNYASTMTVDVMDKVTVQYHDLHDWTIDKAVTWLFKDTFDQTIVGAVTQLYQNTYTQDIVGDVTITIHANVDETVDGEVTYTTGLVVETHHGTKTTTIDAEHTITAGGAQTLHSDVSQTLTAPEQTLTADGLQALNSATHQIVASAEITATAPSVTINGDGSVTIKSGAITIEGGDISITGGNLVIEHGPITMNGSPIVVDGGGQIDMSAGLIKLN